MHGFLLLTQLDFRCLPLRKRSSLAHWNQATDLKIMIDVSDWRES
jgi:hypothetical protein